MQASTQRLLPLWTAGGFHQHRLQAKPRSKIVGQKSSSTIFQPAADQANPSSKGPAFRTMADRLPTISSRPTARRLPSPPHHQQDMIFTIDPNGVDPSLDQYRCGSDQFLLKLHRAVHSAEVTYNARSISHKPDPSVSLPSQATPDPKSASLTIRHQSASTKSWLIPPTIDHDNQHESPASIHGYPISNSKAP
ncbi:hypothetical protein ACLOJK_004253 [Asimina triloba]